MNDELEWPPSDLFGGDITWTEVGPDMWMSEVRSVEQYGNPGRKHPVDLGKHMYWIHNKPDGHHDGLARISFEPGHHTLISESPLHIEPSLRCSCGRHGFIRNGRWVEV